MSPAAALAIMSYASPPSLPWLASAIIVPHSAPPPPHPPPLGSTTRSAARPRTRKYTSRSIPRARSRHPSVHAEKPLAKAASSDYDRLPFTRTSRLGAEARRRARHARVAYQLAQLSSRLLPGRSGLQQRWRRPRRARWPCASSRGDASIPRVDGRQARGRRRPISAGSEGVRPGFPEHR